MRTYKLSICKGVTCRREGADDVFRKATEVVQEFGLTQQCEVRRGGCYGQCHLGTNVVLRENVGRPEDPFHREDFQLMGWPEESFHGGLSVEDVRQLIQKIFSSSP